MTILNDLLKLLDRLPIWKRLQTIPPEVDDLKARVAALEEKLDGKWPADVCRYCGSRAARLASNYGEDDKGNAREIWKCAECGKSDQRLVRPT